MYEVELKFPVSAAAALERDLSAVGGRFRALVTPGRPHDARPADLQRG